MELTKRLTKGGQERWSIRWREGTRRRCKTLNVKSEELAKLALADMIRQRERASVGLASRPSYPVGEALTDYIKGKAGLIGTAQYKAHEARAGMICEVVGEATPVANITPTQLASLRRTLAERGRKAPTINKTLGLLKAAARHAVTQGIITHNPLENMAKVSDSRPPVWRFLDHEEIDTLLSALRDGYELTQKSRSGNEYRAHYDAPAGLYELVMLALHTGGRRGELLALTWGDIDFKARLIRLVSTKRAARGRCASARHVPMSPALHAMLKAMHNRTKPSRGDLVLTISRNNLMRKFEAVCQAAGLGHVRFHDCRHSYCSHLALNGAPLHVIQQLAGHSTLAMTGRYSHLLPNSAAAAVATLNFGSTDPSAKVVDLHTKTG